ncbi:MAG: hypothetical protein ABR548_01080 [Actinomycetota bacterium]
MRRLFVTLAALVLVAAPFLTAHAANTVTSSDIVNGTIRNVDLATGSVNGRVLQNGTVSRVDLTGILQRSLRWSTTLPLQTVRGAVGGDFDVSSGNSCPCGWGVDMTLPSAARSALTDDDVYVNVDGWVSGDTGQTAPTTTDTGGGACTGSPSNPTAPRGKVCIYVAGADNAFNVNGYSVRPGADASPYGFKLHWESAASVTGDTFIDAVWAYTG